MKRNYAVERALHMRHWDPPYLIPASVIPPRSVVRYLKQVPGDETPLGTPFRIGYYSKQDGPNVVWLVDNQGKYVETWDQKSLREHFEIVELADEVDIYGVHREKLGPTKL